MWTCKLCHVDFRSESIEFHLYRNHVKPYFGPIAVFRCGHTGCAETGESFEQMAEHCLRAVHDPCTISEGPNFAQYFSTATDGGLFHALQETMMIPHPSTGAEVSFYSSSSKNNNALNKESSNNNNALNKKSSNNNNAINMGSSKEGIYVVEGKSKISVNSDEMSQSQTNLMAHGEKVIGWKAVESRTSTPAIQDSLDCWRGKADDLSLLLTDEYTLVEEKDEHFLVTTIETDNESNPPKDDTDNESTTTTDFLSPKITKYKTKDDSSIAEETSKPFITKPTSTRRSKYPTDGALIYENGLRLFRCVFCPKMCQSAAARQIHQRGHTGERPFACSECPLAFIEKGMLKKHRRIHTGERPLSCSSCDRTFLYKEVKDKHELRFHNIGVRDEKRFCCPSCSKTFTERSKVRIHQRIHTRDFPYGCSDCGKKFNGRWDLIRHMNNVHKKGI